MAALIIALILFVLTIVCYIQIITKAGYSPWWILLPLSLPVLWLIATADAFHGFSSGLGTFGVFDPQGIADQEKALGWLILLDIIANYVMLVAFAFSDWPVIQAARSQFPPPATPAAEVLPVCRSGPLAPPQPPARSADQWEIRRPRVPKASPPAGTSRGPSERANRATGTARYGRRSGSGAEATGWTSHWRNRSRWDPKGPQRRPTEQRTWRCPRPDADS